MVRKCCEGKCLENFRTPSATGVRVTGEGFFPVSQLHFEKHGRRTRVEARRINDYEAELREVRSQAEPGNVD